MTIEGAVLNRLRNYAGITALIGTRSWALQVSGSTYPAIAFHHISMTRPHAMGSDPTLYRSRFQISCWDDDYDGVGDLAQQVEAAFSRWNATADGTEVLDTRLEGVGTHLLMKEAESDLYHVPVDVIIDHRG